MQLVNLFYHNDCSSDVEFSRLLCDALGEDDADYCYVISKLTRIYGRGRLLEWTATTIERLLHTKELNTPGGMLLKIIRRELTAPVWKAIFK